jgi:hypothetical protein
MATNYNNEFCVQCETFTYKGDGIRLEHNGSWRTFCTTCAAARQANKNTAVSRAAYRNRQPKLFTEEVKEADFYAKQEEILEQWHNETKEHIWPVEIESVGSNEYGHPLITCMRCNGSGECSFHLRFGTTCFGCSGTGLVRYPFMSEKQISYIRQLFKSVRHKMTIDEQEELIEVMKAAINKTKRVNKFWAGQTIDKLKNLNTERSTS